MTYTRNEIEQLIHQFENQSLPKEKWTHAAHLMVSIWYSSLLSGEELWKKVKTGIIKYNEAVGTPNTTSSGYHETITRFWLWSAQSFLKNHSYDSVEEAGNRYINSSYGEKNFPLTFYSKNYLFSQEARLYWLAPDLKKWIINLTPPQNPKLKKYMIVEYFHPQKVRTLYERFDQKGRLLPEGVHYIDSWIDEEVKVCYQLMESKSREALEEWVSRWQDLADFEIVPILSSAEAKAKVFATK